MKTTQARNVALCALLAAAGAASALAATSPTIAIRAVAKGQNLAWGRLHATSVPLNWSWPDGATRADLRIFVNGRRAAVLKQSFTDTSVSSYDWTVPTPSEDTIYTATLTFDTGDVQSAQLYANPGAFGGVALKGWGATSGRVTLSTGAAIPYRAAWADGLAGAATFALDDSATALAYSDGYLAVPRTRGSFTATLDFAVEPSSPAFSVGADVTGPGIVFVIR